MLGTEVNTRRSLCVRVCVCVCAGATAIDAACTGPSYNWRSDKTIGPGSAEGQCTDANRKESSDCVVRTSPLI